MLIGGLDKAVELNGKVAVVFGFDQSAGRYIVELENGGGQKRVRIENLTSKGSAVGVLAARARAAATSMNAAPSPVRSPSTPPAASRSHAGVAATLPKPAQRPGNQFLAGTRVLVDGLKNAPDLNGKSAIIRDFDSSSGRYVVEFEGGTQKSLRPDNLMSKAKTTQAVSRDTKFDAMDDELHRQLDKSSEREGPMAGLPRFRSIPGLS